MRRRWVRGLPLLVLMLLLGAPAWMTYRQVKQESLDHALLAAIKQRNTPEVLSLLDQGANANARERRTPSGSWWQHFLALWSRKPPPAEDEGRSALRLAFEPGEVRGYLKIAMGCLTMKKGQLVSLGSFVTGAGLQPAANRKLVEPTVIVQALLAKGARGNGKDEDGTPLLIYPVAFGYFDCVRLMVEKGADVNAIDNGGNCVLMYADTQGNPRISRWLREHHAKNYSPRHIQ